MGYARVSLFTGASNLFVLPDIVIKVYILIWQYLRSNQNVHKKQVTKAYPRKTLLPVLLQKAHPVQK